MVNPNFETNTDLDQENDFTGSNLIIGSTVGGY